MRVAFDPVVLLLLTGTCWLYLRALRTARRRGLTIGRGQQACWWIGIALVTVALNGPLDAYDGELMSAHMAQHLLLGDVAAPFLLAGLRAPLLLFWPPRPALVLLARQRWLRRIFRTLRQPLVALPLYVLTVWAWHYGVLFEGALEHPLLHALQHECFLAANLLLWWPVLEPQKRHMPGHLWKIGYIFAARMSSMFLGMIFVFARGVLYEGAYGSGERPLGYSPRGDQGTAGGMMMVLDILIIISALTWFFWKASQQEDRDQAAAAAAAQSQRPPRSATPI